MFKRAAASISAPLILALFMLSPGGCVSSETGDSGGTGSSSGKTSSSGGSSGAQPGCEPTLRCAGFCQEQACLDACLDGATDQGVARFWALSDCGGAASCMDLACTIAACPTEYDACLTDLGEGGIVCFAEGIYLACDGGGNCSEKVALGGAWGADDAEAKAGAAADCTDHMLTLIAIEQINGGAAEVGLSCSVYDCGPNQ